MFYSYPWCFNITYERKSAICFSLLHSSIDCRWLGFDHRAWRSVHTSRCASRPWKGLLRLLPAPMPENNGQNANDYRISVQGTDRRQLASQWHWCVYRSGLVWRWNWITKIIFEPIQAHCCLWWLWTVCKRLILVTRYGPLFLPIQRS